MLSVARIISPIYVMVDIALITAACLLSYYWRYNIGGADNIILPDALEYSVIFALWLALLLSDLNRKKLFVTDRNLSIMSEMGRVFSAVSRSSIVIGTIIFVLQYKFFSRQVFVCSFVSVFVALAFWRACKRIFVRQCIKEGYQNKNVLIVGVGRNTDIVKEEIKRHPYFGLKIVGYLANDYSDKFDTLGTFDNFESVVKQYFVDEILITESTNNIEILGIMRRAKALRLGVRVVPADFEHSYPILDITHLGIVPLLTYKEHVSHASNSALKRFFDIVVSLLALILLSPIFAMFSLLIKMESKGPIFFKQERVGLKGKVFNFYKFRSMVANAEALKEDLKAQNEVKDGVIFKIKEDPRITKIGRFIRKYSVDELPQLFNVLKGDMSLVGPRPPVPSEVKEYGSEQMERLSIRPGITGMSQVKGRSNLSFRNWVRWDIWYINNWSFALDIMILIWTVPAVLKGEGAY